MAVTLPKELLVYGPCYDTNGISGSSHGFQGTLLKDRDASVSLFAEYMDPVSQFPAEGSDAEERFVIKGSHPASAGLVVISRGSTMLGGLSAKRIVGKLRPPGETRDVIIEVVFARRVGKADDSVFYQIAFRAPADRYEVDKRVFDAVVSSFRLIPPGS